MRRSPADLADLNTRITQMNAGTTEAQRKGEELLRIIRRDHGGTFGAGFHAEAQRNARRGR